VAATATFVGKDSLTPNNGLELKLGEIHRSIELQYRDDQVDLDYIQAYVKCHIFLSTD